MNMFIHLESYVPNVFDGKPRYMWIEAMEFPAGFNEMSITEQFYHLRNYVPEGWHPVEISETHPACRGVIKKVFPANDGAIPKNAQRK